MGEAAANCLGLDNNKYCFRNNEDVLLSNFEITMF